MRMPPRVTKTPRGIYVFRYYEQGRERRISLKTRDPARARILGFLLNSNYESLLEKSMFSDDKKKGISISPLGVRRLPDGTLDIYDIGPNDLELAQKFLDNNSRKLDLGRKVPVIAPGSLENDAGLSNLQKEEINAEKKQIMNGLGSLEPAQPEKTLDEVVELYGKLKTDITDQNNAEQRSIVRHFFKTSKTNNYMLIRKQHALDYANKLKMGDDEAGIKQTAHATYNKKISALQSFFSFLSQQDLYSLPNPFEQIPRASKSAIKKTRKTYARFEQKELALIFNPETYFKKFGHHPGLAIAPLLAYFTGARLGEVSDRLCKHVLVRDGVNCIEIPMSDAKTESSARIIPLSKHLEELGIPAFLQKLANSKSRDEKLFQKKITKSGFKKNMSRAFAEYLDEIGIRDETKVFHSFRHTFISSMNNTRGVNEILLMKITGHSEEMNLVILKSTHTETYNQHETEMTTLRDTADLFQSSLSPSFKKAFIDYLSKVVI
jgi:integrase